MQSCSVKLAYNWLIYSIIFAATLHNDILCIKQKFNLISLAVILKDLARA